MSVRTATAPRTSGSASAAPVPSPKRSPRSSSGSSPSAWSTRAWPGSGERVAAISEPAHRASSRAATMAAAPVMNPSTSTGSRRADAPRVTPTRYAISSPPTAASTSIGSRWGRSSSRASPRLTASTFRESPSSSTPVPAPHTAEGSAGRSAAASALAEVVFAIPISPSPTISTPSSESSSASTIPRSIIPTAIERGIAGPSVRSSVPRTPSTISERTPWTEAPPITPASTTISRAPASRARTQIAAPPPAKFASICAVTSCG